MVKEIDFSTGKLKIEDVDLEESKKVREHWEKGTTPFENDDQKFVDWFDTSDTFEKSWKTGQVDFHNRILTPEMLFSIGEPFDKKSLEIGFGGGRLLNAAAQIFDHAYGVDIHSSFDKVSSLLQEKGRKNFTLLKQDMLSSLPDKSIDFCYSFIVFQHFDSIKTHNYYLDQIKRVLKPTGCGIIYMGMAPDNTTEDYAFTGFDNIAGKGHGGNSTLFLNPQYAVQEFSKRFDLFQAGRFTKKPWVRPETENLSSQFFITFKSKGT